MQTNDQQTEPWIVYCDGDWGGDELQESIVLLHLMQLGKIEIAGFSTVFGNTDVQSVTNNAITIARLLGLDLNTFPIFVGASCAINGSVQEKDNAHGSDGIGGAQFYCTPNPPVTSRNQGDFLSSIQTKITQGRKVIILATGPLTNIAKLIELDPQTMSNVTIIAMGGCTEKIDIGNATIRIKGHKRQGNIAEFAEFNVYQDPISWNDVANFYFQQYTVDINSNKLGEMYVLPMNATHSLTLTPKREDRLRSLFPNLPESNSVKNIFMEQLIKAMQAPVVLDRTKFDSYPVMHDVHTVLFLIHRFFQDDIRGDNVYSSKQGLISVSLSNHCYGKTSFDKNGISSLFVVQCNDPDKAFETLVLAVYNLSIELLNRKYNPQVEAIELIAKNRAASHYYEM